MGVAYLLTRRSHVVLRVHEPQVGVTGTEAVFRGKGWPDVRKRYPRPGVTCRRRGCRPQGPRSPFRLWHAASVSSTPIQLLHSQLAIHSGHSVLETLIRAVAPLVRLVHQL